MHRSNPWASYWLKRYDIEGLEGLKDRIKTGRPPELSEETSYQIKKELSNSKQGWTTKQVEELIIKKSGIKYHYTHIYRILHKWGFKQKVPRKVTCKYCIFGRERCFQKKTEQIFMDIQQKQQKQQKQDGFTIVSTDESFFFYDYLVRRVWIKQDKRPVVRVTGSHQHSCIFGAISLEGGKQLFRQYDKFNGTTFLDYLKKIHIKFEKCYLFMDKASQHYKSKKVLKYFEENKDT